MRLGLPDGSLCRFASTTLTQYRAVSPRPRRTRGRPVVSATCWAAITQRLSPDSTTLVLSAEPVGISAAAAGGALDERAGVGGVGSVLVVVGAALVDVVDDGTVDVCRRTLWAVGASVGSPAGAGTYTWPSPACTCTPGGWFAWFPS